MEFASETIWAWRLIFQEFLNYEFDFLNHYNAVQSICHVGCVVKFVLCEDLVYLSSLLYFHVACRYFQL